MARKPALDPRRVREEIAAVAAKLIAEDGFDFASAKRKAARQLLGDSRIAGEWLPDNEMLEDEVREYQSLFQSDSQPAILFAMRRIALQWMGRLAAFDPYVTGAVWNGTAGAHSDIHLQLFSDASKDIAIFLLNAGVEYDAGESRHAGGKGMVETLSFVVRDDALREAQAGDTDAPHGLGGAHAGADGTVGIHLSLYPENDLRGAMRSDPRGRPVRGTARMLSDMLEAQEDA
ncbi:UDP-N-acetylmuramate--alanine ligase [Robbsia sp. KACC 23696]|uniref:UDP-N-acetylmuramate--alanine ligase n=1 Tax=Robbsia sp. KACC 23696 TaxID=3149231 RepID=UPI00325AED8A